MNDSKCCEAKISVGAIYATCNLSNFSSLLFTVMYEAVAATAVLPDPTSPSRRRDIGYVRAISDKIVSIDFVCELVGEKGKRFKNSCTSLSFTGILKDLFFRYSILSCCRSS